MSLRVSCVVFQPDEALLEATLVSLQRALNELNASSSSPIVAVDLVDNTLTADAHTPASWQNFAHNMASEVSVRRLFGHGNIGFGAAHNLSVSSFDTTYHLILNPDVILNPNALVTAIHFMDQHPDVALLSPESRDPANGKIQFQCKRNPDICVLILRLLNLRILNRLFAKRLAHYEERDNILAGKPFEANIVSGCFMLFRTAALQSLKGFDERYFLYFEDFDLSLRAQGIGRVVYHPEVKIQHFGGGAGRKGAGHLIMFARSAVRFFRLHGWKFF